MTDKDSTQASEQDSLEQDSLQPDSSMIWQCLLCDHLESQSSTRCSACQYWRLDSRGVEVIETVSINHNPSSSSSDRDPEDALTLALARLQQLFVRSQEEGRELSAEDQAEVYETLLRSLLKIERSEMRRTLIKKIFQQEREERQRTHMIHLSLIWFLGICMGFFLYLGLELVSGS